MSRKKRNRQAGQVASKSWDWLRRGAAQVKPAARSTGATARRGIHKSRAWAAPQIERTGQVLQDRVAPKASSLLNSAAERIEPRQPRRARRLKLAAISVLTAAAGAGAALASKRRKPGADGTTSGEADAGGGQPLDKEQNEQAR
jgi:hypothetical protein